MFGCQTMDQHPWLILYFLIKSIEAFKTKPDIKHQLTNGITGLPIQYIEHNQIGTSQRV